jgi:hypothetical protein
LLDIKETPMKKLILFLLLLPALAWGGEPIEIARMNPYILGSGVSAAAACSSGTVDASQTGGSSTITTTLFGQSFTVSSDNSYLYSIIVRFYCNTSETCTDTSFTLRYGNAENMSSSYWGTASTTISGLKHTNSVDYEFVVQDTTNVMNTGNTYYFVLVKTSGTQVLGYGNSSGGYAGGQQYSTSATDYNLTGHEDPSNDLTFTVKVCD